VDIIIALGMAKEGFDWIWCEHALTVGYRSSLTEIVQIIGRATRDAPGKTRTRFSNLIAEPDASDELVNEAVNDTLKAIGASLLMEQVLAPRFAFKPKNPQNQPMPGFDYGETGYQPGHNNVGINTNTGQIQIEIKGLTPPKSREAKRICQEDLLELTTALVQDKVSLERGLFDSELVSEEITHVRLGKIVQEKYPHIEAEDQEAVRQHAIAALNLVQQGSRMLREQGATYGATPMGDPSSLSNLPDSAIEIKVDPLKPATRKPLDPGREPPKNLALIDGVRQFALSVTELDIDLIDRINPFSEAYAILAKSMTEARLKQLQEIITAKKVVLDLDEARKLAKRASAFKQERGRLPSITAADPWEKLMAEGLAFLTRKAKEEQRG
jgi:hypothetical protein